MVNCCWSSKIKSKVSIRINGSLCALLRVMVGWVSRILQLRTLLFFLSKLGDVFVILMVTGFKFLKGPIETERMFWDVKSNVGI